MSPPTTCPGCAAPVSAEDAARGTCGYCGQPLEEVVDLGEPEAAPTDAPPAPAVPPVEEVVELGPEAEVSPEPPPAPKRPRSEGEPPRPPRRAPRDLDEIAPRQPPRPSFRPRDYDDEGDRPRPRRPAKSGGGRTVLVVGTVLVASLFGCGGLGVAAYWFVGRSTDVARTQQTVPLDRPLPPPIVKMGATGPVNRAWERGWGNTVHPHGWSARLPDGGTGGLRTVTIDGVPTRGHRHTAEEAEIEYRVEWYDWTADGSRDPALFVQKLVSVDTPAAVPVGPPRHFGPATVRWVEAAYDLGSGRYELIRAQVAGTRVFIFSVSYNPSRYIGYDGLDPDARRKVFFDSVQVTYRPTTPAPPSTVATGPKKGKEPPAETQPAATLTRTAGVFPHTTSLYLPKAREVLTFVPKGPTGLAHRYEVPSFRHIKPVVLPNPVSLAVADEKAGRLYVATYAPGPGLDPRERLDAVGDVLAFDLAAVRSDSPQDAPLKPVGTLSLGAKVTALELSPDGRFLYVAVIEPPDGLPAKPKSKLIKITAPGLGKVAEQPVPAPVLGARLSPDGKTLIEFEHPFNAVGQPVFGTTGNGFVRGLDADSMKIRFSAATPGHVSDLRFVAPDRAVAVVVTANRPRLAEVTATGTVTDVTPAGGLKSLQAGYLGWFPGRLVTSTRIPGTTGAEVLAVKPGGLPASLAFESVLEPSTLSGPVTVTPDGRYAVFASGAVAEVKDGK